MSIILAAKSAPQKSIFDAIQKAGIGAVELYLSGEIMHKNRKNIISLCKKYDFSYAVHAPNDECDPESLAEIVQNLKAKIVIFHNIFWEDEWTRIAKVFGKVPAQVCVENVSSILDAVKYIRRFGFSRCLDLEHLQFEIGGIYEEEFIRVIKESLHLHATGYFFGSEKWHTHLHHSKRQSHRLLKLIKQSGYSGMVVSEAKSSLQTYDEFSAVYSFFKSSMESLEKPELTL